MLADYLDQFDRLFPGVKAAYNGKSYYVWSSGDPHLLGAYSYLKVGQYTGFNGIQGQPEGNLHFAGEQTSVNFQGYIEGALRSGYRCATEARIGSSGATPPARGPSHLTAGFSVCAACCRSTTQRGARSRMPEIKLDSHHRATVEKIFSHPTSHNIDWRDVLSLLEAVGSVDHEHDGRSR